MKSFDFLNIITEATGLSVDDEKFITYMLERFNRNPKTLDKFLRMVIADGKTFTKIKELLNG